MNQYSESYSASPEDRALFVTKTYMHLFGAIVAFVGLEAFLLRNDAARDIAYNISGSWWLVLGAFFIVSWLATMFARSASKPVQYAGLALYTCAEAAIFLPLLMAAEVAIDPNIIAKAGAVTLSGFFALTGIAFVTRKNFSFLRGFLMWAGVIALLLIGASMIFSFNLGVIFSVGMVGIAGASILYTTSNIIHEYDTDSYVGASLELFSAFALMLWYVVQIFMSFDD